ncbi:hypothetical protein SAMN02799631_00543 [Methylobacterium sp. 174MFSha1.1]|uniref:hypothetical protein n=1 Tax=Methylobacterium sp. 174MFSha1.1 TaxID=1502749 RepID=UPI0008EC04D6|nr:hypothetical protein [Methylobacterium sp. 174MFSha1.1]SFU41303.1 hypothetical protein SAMN02799631_00543 [Methylobacterium sp. 174MFSha1.1]
MRTAARAHRFVDPALGGEPRRSDRSCETRRGEVRPGTDPGRARPVGEIWSQQDSRGLTARELIRLAQAVRLRPARPPE